MASPIQIHAAQALDQAAAHLIEAAGNDPFISRRDARNKVGSLSGEAADLVERFYRFIDDRDDEKGARVTAKDVEKYSAYVKKHFIDNFDLDNYDQSRSSAGLPVPARLAVDLVSILKRIGEKGALAENDMESTLTALCEGLFIDDFGSEAEGPVIPLFLDTDVQEITEASIIAAFNLDQNNVDEKVERFFPLTDDPSFWPDFIQANELRNKTAQAAQLRDYMLANLSQLTVVLLGVDNLATDSAHRTLVVGLNDDGDIAGFETIVIWT